MTEHAPSVGVIGTVGVPAKYGGFETLMQQLAIHVTPDAAKLHLYGQRSAYTAAERAGGFAGHRRHFLPLSANGPQSMAHDALTILHAALIVRVDVLLALGMSGAWIMPLARVLRPSMQIITNIDGLESRRDKFGSWTKRLVKLLEWLAMRTSTTLIADNAALIPIVRNLHGVNPVLIAYGGDHVAVQPAPGEVPRGHWLAVARIEPENNSSMILAAAARAGVSLIYVGNWQANRYARALKAKWGQVLGLQLLDPVYDLAELARLRAGAVGYLHGHSVGGTNPSLVEALFETDRILAFDCSFNRATLRGCGQYFCNEIDLAALLCMPGSGTIAAEPLAALRASYRWQSIAAAYLELMAAGSGV